MWYGTLSSSRQSWLHSVRSRDVHGAIIAEVLLWLMVALVVEMLPGVHGGTMKHRNKPAYWQLYVFTLLMCVILLLLMWAQFPQGWYTIIDDTWAVLDLT